MEVSEKNGPIHCPLGLVGMCDRSTVAGCVDGPARPEQVFCEGELCPCVGGAVSRDFLDEGGSKIE